MMTASLSKQQKNVISTVTFGNILEWYDIYSYAYLAPVLARLFFNFESFTSNLIGSFTIFGAGFLARLLGAILFGRIGDLIGRKRAFVLSITLMTVPTFIMGCIPTYAQAGIWAPILLVILRITQSIPAAGESPGAFCFLYENSEPTNRKFMTSWGAVGNQIGAILGIIATFLMDQFMSESFLMSWGWRISFWSGGLIGLSGIYLRSKLDETPSFIQIKEHHKIDTETVRQVLKHYRKNIWLGTAFGVINAVTFYWIASYLPTYFDSEIGLTENFNILISLLMLVLTTVFLPVFGALGDRFSIRPIFIFCGALIILLLYPLYVSVDSLNVFAISILGVIYLIPITCMTALLPYLLTHLFPTPVRFTGVGLSFNLADGIVGGFTPAISLVLLRYTGNEAAFCWFILACAVISLISYFRIKE